ncbi:YbjN domain-containing protein [Henriciella litoralis]|uniref:YbjN domain-containing protein n=1 Tax=Henriciella litoralis TaxID=568102 RepID=UPI000A0477CE|nr:YbjN domain-containing protein [Henriciella litoralis]
MKFTSIAVAALALAMPAFAQSDDQITYVTEDSLAEFAEGQGHEILGYGEAGAISVRAETEDGTVYYLTGTACNEGKCAGVNMSARFEANDLVTMDRVNQANLNYAAVSVWRLDNTYGISRYVILDGGMSEENLQINFDNFIAIVPMVVVMFDE